MSVTNTKNKHFFPNEKLEVLLQAENLGNVSRVCKAYGINRTTYYNWLKRHQADKSDGLNKKVTSYHHPLKTRPDIVKRVVNLCLSNPEWGCNRLSTYLSSEGIKISSPTIQKILIRKKLGTNSQRLFRIEERFVKDGFPLNPNHLNSIIKNDPSFTEIGKIGSYPGEVLVQDTFPIFCFFPNTYVHVIIDTYSSYAFAYPWPNKSTEAIIHVLNAKVSKFFSGMDFQIKRIITDRGYEFTRQGKIYADYLNSHGITHEVFPSKNRNWNGFIVRYKNAFFKHSKLRVIEGSDSVSMGEMLQSIKNDKLYSSKVILGYPNFGLSPSELIDRHYLTKLESD